MKISVIVPTYKPQEYLWECLESIYSQTLAKTEYELLLVLNGCKEPYDTEIKQWLSEHKDLDVKYIQTDEGGVSNARNIALDHASGEYVTFIDDDDFVSPSYLEELLGAAGPDTISFSNIHSFNDGYRDEVLYRGACEAYEYCSEHGCEKFSCKVQKFFSGPYMKLIPMSFIQGRRYDRRFQNGEDSLYMFLISDRYRHFALAPRTAVYYRRVRAGSACTVPRPLSKILKNQLMLIGAYTYIYMSHPLRYNALFYLTRVLGAFKVIWAQR